MQRLLHIEVALLALFASGCFRLSRERVGANAGTVDFAACEPVRLMASGALRSSDVMREESHERLELVQTTCGTEQRTDQEWQLGRAQTIAQFDRNGFLQRVWKRTVLPGRGEVSARTDLRVFQVQNSGSVFLRQGRPMAEIESFLLRGGRPRALIAPGRLSLTAWIQRANLRVGGRLREIVLDVRERIELVRPVTLLRLADDDVDGLGRVRVYTIYGREPVYTDMNNVVVGDMLGMRRAQSVQFALEPATTADSMLLP